MKTSDIINLPNVITFLRVPLAFLWLAYYQDHGIQLGIIVVIILTDIIDGYLARKLRRVTDFGKIFDPICDKSISLFAFFCFYFLGKINGGQLFIFIARDVFIFMAVIFYLLFFRKYKIKWRARFLGKLTTAAQFLAIFAFTLSYDYFLELFILVFVFSFLSIMDYSLFFISSLKKREVVAE